MKKNILQDISASTFQVVINQAFGLFVFIITSRYLQKEAFGEMNWSLAVLTFISTILSLRLEQIVVRKVAAGDDASKMLTLFAGHSFFAGILFYGLLLIAHFIFPVFFSSHNLLLILAISQLISFFSLPYKQIANGREQFGLLAIMSSVANIVKLAGLAACMIWSVLTIEEVVLVYIIAATCELLVCMYIIHVRLHVHISSMYTFKDYLSLLHESLPQLGMVALNAAIARFDWILLGIFSTAIITAEYSFAYKVFELCPLPMLILGPVLLSRFSKYFSTNAEASLSGKKKEIGFYIRCAMLAATFLPLILNISWVPLADLLSNGKYGAVNKTTFLLLSLSLPFQYMNNLLWTIEFSQNRLGLIFRITAITCAVIVVGDFLMIPGFHAKGAAIIYLLATIVEYLVYLRYSFIARFKESWQPLLLFTGAAVLAGIGAMRLGDNISAQLIIAVLLYGALLPLTGMVQKADLLIIRDLLHHSSPKAKSAQLVP